MKNPLVFFVGIANYFKKKGLFYEALFFYKLAVYVDPFCHRGWSKLIEVLVNMGLHR